ncbi:MAG TPA: MaoC family dehydratase, partial [Candidatus Sulfotelmatobacter sp.]|nr:MaoC family dehydratase [Candidatus Sulfotelmatobacter sp.]
MSARNRLRRQGNFYEDFEVGSIYEHPYGRTILDADNVWFTNLTMNTNPSHFDYVYAAKMAFGKPLVNSAYTLALATGLSVSDISENALANLGWDTVRLPNPLFVGDTLYAE